MILRKARVSIGGQFSHEQFYRNVDYEVSKSTEEGRYGVRNTCNAFSSLNYGCRLKKWRETASPASYNADNGIPCFCTTL